jgi:hypothetical protein
VLRRIRTRNKGRRSTSPDSLDLIDPRFGFVPNAGFEWIEGRAGPHGARHRFLVPKSAHGITCDIPTDLYLTFANLQPTPEGVLEFANRYGSLGLVKRHFHSEHSAVQLAECWIDWNQELAEFKFCLDAWLIAEDQDGPAADRLLRERHWPRLVDDRIVSLKGHLVMHICSKLQPQEVFPDVCFKRACKGDHVPGRLTPFVVYSLKFQLPNTPTPTVGSTPILGRLTPTALASSMWLQLAELVTRSRVIRRCERCHQWMDITESPRKGAKRMHERCSLALRMARYRQKKRTSNRGSG